MSTSRELDKSGIISEELPIPVLVNMNGKPLSKDDAFGIPETHRLVHLGNLVFVDEVGSNTDTNYMKREQHIAGEDMLVEKGALAQQKAAVSDNHFTVTDFTVAVGEPNMCAIIFDGEAWRRGSLCNRCSPKGPVNSLLVS